MNIRIENHNARKHSVEFHELYLKALNRKTIRQTLTWLAVGLFVFGLEFANSGGIRQFGNPKPINFYFLASIGIAACYLALSYYMAHVKTSAQNRKLLELHLETFFSGSTPEVTILTDQGISCTEEMVSMEMKWPVITAFSLYKDYLLLYKMNTAIQPLYFHRSLFSPDDFDELLLFLSQNKKHIDTKHFPNYVE